ncbi:unnamed protein product [Moneuplotes crassus]|uniref:Uncharacterized protein n=2 Tax=Euplotes crassus TaxID=5936 RepID=A0AAD1UGE2_EUPCR|nr:unnamed protein product [Moneuplotes crassus]
MNDTKEDGRINPEIFDEPPLHFEQTDDYGWTTIARAIVQMDGDIHKYIKQMRKKKTAEEKFKDLPFMRISKRRRTINPKDKSHQFGRKNMIKFGNQETFKFNLIHKKTSSLKSVPRSMVRKIEKAKATKIINILGPQERFPHSKLIMNMIKNTMDDHKKKQKRMKSSPERAKNALIRTLNKSFHLTKYQKLETYIGSPERKASQDGTSKLRVSMQDPEKLFNNRSSAKTPNDSNRRKIKLTCYSSILGAEGNQQYGFHLKRSSRKSQNKAKICKIRGKVRATSYHENSLLSRKSHRGNSVGKEPASVIQESPSGDYAQSSSVKDNPVLSGENSSEATPKVNPYLYSPKLIFWHPPQNPPKPGYDEPSKTIDYVVGVGSKSPRMKFSKPVLKKRNKYIYKLM